MSKHRHPITIGTQHAKAIDPAVNGRRRLYILAGMATLITTFSGAAATAATRDDAYARRVEGLMKACVDADFGEEGETQQNSLRKALADVRKFEREFPKRAEPLALEGMILTATAGSVGGMKGFSLVKQARTILEKAVALDERVLNGLPLVRLGVIYHRVPEWPMGFGDPAKATEYFNKALAIAPDGMDANLYYARFLIDQNKPAEAVPYLRKALAATPLGPAEIRQASIRETLKAAEEAAANTTSQAR